MSKRKENYMNYDNDDEDDDDDDNPQDHPLCDIRRRASGVCDIRPSCFHNPITLLLPPPPPFPPLYSLSLFDNV